MEAQRGPILNNSLMSTVRFQCPSLTYRVWLTKTVAALLRNFTEALDQVNIVPKRFLLQTGAKNYGVHLGRARSPYVESDPRHGIEPNFYFPQEDILFDYAKRNKIGWNIICPAWVIGATNK